MVHIENGKKQRKLNIRGGFTYIYIYSQQLDFRRNIIKGSILAQRRKIVTWELVRVNVHIPPSNIEKISVILPDFVRV